MYYDFFGFREAPFSIAPDPRYLYLSERHREALAHLMYGIQGQGGFVVITGEVGTGKTTVSRCFIENVPANVDVALILNPKLSARELLSGVCDELGIGHDPNASIKTLIDRINRHLLQAHAAGRHQVLMIDEAQNLSAEVLEQLRLLTNLETTEKKLLQIVLLGQPELQDILARPELRQLNQRVTARYHLDALEYQELPAYLHYRLGVAGVKSELFSARAVKKLFRASGGVPRLINLISDRALLGAYAEGCHQVEPRHIRAAFREVSGDPKPDHGNAEASPALRYLTLAASLAAAVVLTLALLDRGLVNLDARASDGAGGAGGAAVDPIAGAVEREDPAQDPLGRVAPIVLRESGPEADAGPGFRLADHGVTSAQAYAGLFRLWDRSWQPSDNPIACNYAGSLGLRCLHRQGNRSSLERINRPAVLELRDERGGRHFVTLAGLDGNTAILQVAEGYSEVRFSELEKHWYGDFTVLWQLPPYLAEEDSEELEPGQREGVWLSARLMQLVNMHARDAAENQRVSHLDRDAQVRWYQRVKGLEADGIAGTMTLIQLNNDLDAGVPRLVRRQEPG